MATTTTETSELREFAAPARHPFFSAVISIVKTPVGAGSLLIILLLVVVAIATRLTGIAPYDPRAFSVDTFAPPGIGPHLLGTDKLGRDILSRLMQASWISLYAGFLTVSFGTLVGSFLGITTGFIGGYFDLTLQRVVDAIQSVPALMITIAIISVIGPSTTNAILAISVFIAASNSRVIRGAVLSIKENVYIEAAAATGASPMRVMFRHVLPNVAAPMLILISAGFGAAILIEGALSFLGLATQAPDVSWGIMLRDGRDFIERAPWQALFAGSSIAFTVLSFNLLGDVVRDVLDPRLRGSR